MYGVGKHQLSRSLVSLQQWKQQVAMALLHVMAGLLWSLMWLHRIQSRNICGLWAARSAENFHSLVNP